MQICLLLEVLKLLNPLETANRRKYT